MLAALWAFEGRRQALIACTKFFKYLMKMAETCEATKVMQITLTDREHG
jgi:hypothetical protein